MVHSTYVILEPHAYGIYNNTKKYMVKNMISIPIVQFVR